MNKSHHLILLIFIILTGLSSCNKEKFPKDKNLIGHWIEKTENSAKLELIFNEDHTLYFIKPDGTTNLFNYSLDKSSETLILTTDSGMSGYPIYWNKKNDEITIKNLVPGVPENPSLTTFEKM